MADDGLQWVDEALWRGVDRRDPSDLVDAWDVMDSGVPFDPGRVPDAPLFVGLTVAEVLLEVSLAGPGPDAQRLLASLVGRELCPDDALTAVQLWQAQEAWLVGQQHLALVAFAGPSPVSVKGFRDDQALVHELAAAWSSTSDHAGDQITQARLLSGTLTATGDLLRAGRLSPYLAWMICDRLAELPVDLARDVEARILPKAPGSLGKDLSRRLRRAIDRADPQRAEQRHREGRKNRRVEVEVHEREPGLLGLHAYLPPEQVIAINQRLQNKAAEWAALERAALSGRRSSGGDNLDGDLAGTEPPPALADEPSGVQAVDGVLRTKAQRMADALAWFVLGPDPDDPVRPREPTVTIQVTVDLPTLLRLRDNPADLGRFGSVAAGIAREWAADADWHRSSTNPLPGTC